MLSRIEHTHATRRQPAVGQADQLGKLIEVVDVGHEVGPLQIGQGVVEEGLLVALFVENAADDLAAHRAGLPVEHGRPDVGPFECAAELRQRRFFGEAVELSALRGEFVGCLHRNAAEMEIVGGNPLAGLTHHDIGGQRPVLCEQFGDVPGVVVFNHQVVLPHAVDEPPTEQSAFVFPRELFGSGGDVSAMVFPGSGRLLGGVDLLQRKLPGEKVGEGVAATLRDVHEEVHWRLLAVISTICLLCHHLLHHANHPSARRA